MKLSLKSVYAVLFFMAALFSSPATSLASALPGIPAHQSTTDSAQAEDSYNNPNLNASDGFNESEYRRKIQEKPRKKQRPAAKDLVKHNL